ncbi:MAG: hypothetical protein IPJ62_17230 [Betaproteobacteria bacterium]|nr:hypothetical protein [Betaproteobacteria bacterium]
MSHRATIVVAGIEEPRSRKVCVRPEIDVELSLLPLTVFVGREFRDDDCRRAAIVEHELKHVAVYRAYLDEVAGEVVTPARLGNPSGRFASRARGVELALVGYLNPAAGAHVARGEAAARPSSTRRTNTRASTAACGGIEVAGEVRGEVERAPRRPAGPSGRSRRATTEREMRRRWPASSVRCWSARRAPRRPARPVATGDQSRGPGVPGARVEKALRRRE